MTFILIGALAFAASFVYCSFFEWTLHKYIMHSDHLMKYPHRAHQLEHHEVFKADGTYYIQDEAGKEHLTFAWWNAPLLMGLHLPVLGSLVLWGGGWVAASGALGAMISYYALYEYFHYCMHVPTNRWLERTRMFAFVTEHHRLHHVYYLKNLNVVIPIADFVLGTRVPVPEEGFFQKLERVRQERLARKTAKKAEAAESTATARTDAPEEELAAGPSRK